MFGSLFKPNIARLKEQRNVEGLFDALDHKDELIRKASFNALTEIGDRLVLIRLLGRSSGDAWARGVITGKLLVPQPKDETDLVAAIRNPAADATGLEVLFKYLQDVASGAYFINQWQMGAAVRVLMALNPPSFSQSALRAIVADASGGQSYATREQALQRLDIQSDGDNVALLASLVDENLNSDMITEMTDLEGLKATALRRLAEVKHPLAYAALTKVVRGSRDLESRTVAMISLGRNGAVEVVEPALALLDEYAPKGWYDQTVTIAKKVGECLGSLGPAALDAIGTQMDSDVPLKKLCGLQAVHSLASRHPDVAVPWLDRIVAVLGSPQSNPDLRKLANEIVARIGPGAVEALLNALPGRPEIQRLLAGMPDPPVDLLASRMPASDPDTAKALAQMLRDNLWQPAGVAAIPYFVALREWERVTSFGPEAVAPIKRLVFDQPNDTEVRKPAGRVLSALEDPAVQGLMNLAGTGDAGALLALGYMGRNVAALPGVQSPADEKVDVVRAESLVAQMATTDDETARSQAVDVLLRLPEPALRGIPESMWSDLVLDGDARRAELLIRTFGARLASRDFGSHQTPMGLRRAFSRFLLAVGEAAAEPAMAHMTGEDMAVREVCAESLVELYRSPDVSEATKDKIRSLNGCVIRPGGGQYWYEDGGVENIDAQVFHV